MSLSNRVERAEGASGAQPGPCAMCEARAAKALEPPREFGPEWEEKTAATADFDCPGCGRPFTVNFVAVTRKEAA